MTSTGRAEPRVLIVLASSNRRGAEVAGHQLAADLRELGLDAAVVALAPGSAGAQLDVEALGPSPLALPTLRTLRSRARNVDIVIGYGSTTLTACALALRGLKARFVYRSIGDPGQWLRGSIHRVRTGAQFRLADHVVALWPDAAEQIVRLYRVRRNRISVIPNGADPLQFRRPSAAERTAAREVLGVPEHRRLLVSIGALSEEKRMDMVIEAASMVERADLRVAGDGPCREDLEEICARHPNAQLMGAIEDVPSLLHAADCVVLASRTEGMPGVLIEARLCGVPFVATDVGAVRRIAGPADRIVPAGATVAQVAHAVEECLSSHPHAAEEPPAEFVSTNVAARWAELLRSLGSER